MEEKRLIANRVMFIGRWERYKNTGRSVMYRATCQCASEDCDIVIDLEYDPDIKMVDLNFYKDVYVFDYNMDAKKFSFSWFENIWIRLKKCFRLMTTGFIKMNESFLFQGEEQIETFIQALQQGKEYVLSNKEED